MLNNKSAKRQNSQTNKQKEINRMRQNTQGKSYKMHHVPHEYQAKTNGACVVHLIMCDKVILNEDDWEDTLVSMRPSDLQPKCRGKIFAQPVLCAHSDTMVLGLTV